MRRRGMAVAATCGIVTLGGCSFLPGSEPSETEAKPKRHKVVLEVIGDGVKRADVTFVTQAERNEDRRAKLPWSETVTTVKLAGLSVVAQNIGDAGTLTCTVTVDGKIRKKVTAEGEFALVACDLANVTPIPTPTST